MKIRFGLLLIILGGVLCYYGVQEWRLGSAASAAPREVALKELIAQGPGDNAHVVLTDFILCDNYIYSHQKSSTSWDKIWVPVVPSAEQPNPIKVLPGKIPAPPHTANAPNEIRALVKSTHIHNEADLSRLEAQPKLQGLVVNKIESLSSDEKKKLSESYPGADFAKCLIIEEGREPAGAAKIAGFLGGGVVLVATGALLALFGLRR